MFVHIILPILAGALLAICAQAATPSTSELVRADAQGELVYAAFNSRGDRLPDFSHCGYAGGNHPIPTVPVRESLAPLVDEADSTARIQAAIDRVALLPLAPDGTRGAVLLRRGRWRVGGILEIKASGVVLRGEGAGEDDTVVVATAKRPQPVVRVGGRAGPVRDPLRAVEIVDTVVPVGATTFTVADGHGLKVGDTVHVVRRGNAAWISAVGMDRIQGRPGAPASTRQWEPFDLEFDRVVVARDGASVTIDAPITCAIERTWGGGQVVPYADQERIEHCGVENLRAVSAFDRAKTDVRDGARFYVDEEHASYLVSFGAAKNSWARNLVTRHFGHGPANIGGLAKWITVEDCRSVEPVSLLTGGRRYAFNVNGQLVLVRRCYSDGARHAFIVGARVAGPNVFLDCRSERDYGASEPHHRWSVGGLYDNVEAPIAIQDRQWMGSGHGWSGANYVVWNCRGTLICQQPPTAQNFAIGFVGTRGHDAFPGRPPGWWESEGRHVQPRSLYEAQLAARLKSVR